MQAESKGWQGENGLPRLRCAPAMTGFLAWGTAGTPPYRGVEREYSVLSGQEEEAGMQKRKLSQVGLEAVERMDLPLEEAAGLPQMELYGNRQLYLSGHRGVISYGTEEVAVAGGRLTVRITGKNLQLAAMTEGELRLTGYITQVELME